MKHFYGDRITVVQFVAELLLNFGKNSPWITITVQGKSEVYCVSVATDTLSDAIAEIALKYSWERLDI